MVHVGEDLGYQTTVTSELQSTQAPQFLQVGVLLTITPRITRDNRVLLHVRPEVSTGAIDPITQVPNKKTTELETDVMLNDGEGMIIGGLIDEKDITNQSKVPYLGDLWRVGFLFRKSDVTKERKEIIIALVPRIQPYNADYHNFEQGEMIRARDAALSRPLCYIDRPYEAHLPDGKRVAKPYIPPPAIRPRDRPRHLQLLRERRVRDITCRRSRIPRENIWSAEPNEPLVDGARRLLRTSRANLAASSCRSPRLPASNRAATNRAATKNCRPATISPAATSPATARSSAINRNDRILRG